MQFLFEPLDRKLLDEALTMGQLPARTPALEFPMSLVNIIAACTDRKRLVAPKGRQMRSISVLDIERRFSAWRKALAANTAETTQASDLYCGDHWSIARALPAVASAGGWNARLWIASAGYGLIPADAQIAPYSATFAPGHADSIVRSDPSTSREQVRTWWSRLGSVSGPDPSTPGYLSDLAGASPAAMVVVASDVYIDAMEDDLIAARTRLPDPERLIVVSSRAHRTTGIGSNWIETNARLRQVLGGAAGSLNVRVARYILQTLSPKQFSVTAARSCVEHILEMAPTLPSYDRASCTDTEVKDYILSAFRSDPLVCHSPLLRQFRASGMQCEQGRFRTLFGQVTGKV
jgi:hypothetical protein